MFTASLKFKKDLKAPTGRNSSAQVEGLLYGEQKNTIIAMGFKPIAMKDAAFISLS